jgi:hypothetical protein
VQSTGAKRRRTELAGFARNYPRGIERGERNVCLINIVKLAHALAIKPAKLIETIS